MTERIKELFEQAANKKFPTGVDKIHPSELEKFAELIVKECILCCDELDRTNKYYISKYGLDPEIGPKQCIDVIKTHFGINQ